jgi:hypothetical protein
MSAKVERWEFGTDLAEELLTAITLLGTTQIRQINSDSFRAERGHMNVIINIPLSELQG